MANKIAMSNSLAIVLAIMIIIGLFSIPALYSLGLFNPLSYGIKIDKKQECRGFDYFNYINHNATTSDLILELQNGNKIVNIVEINFGGEKDITPSILGKNEGEWLEEGEVFTIKADDITLEPGGYDSFFLLIKYTVQGSDINISDFAPCSGTVY